MSRPKRRKTKAGKPIRVWDYRGWIITQEHWPLSPGMVYLLYANQDAYEDGANECSVTSMVEVKKLIDGYLDDGLKCSSLNYKKGDCNA